MTQKELLDEIEKWLKEAPTHPMIQYGLSLSEHGGLLGIHPLVVYTWNTDAMLSEWSIMRRRWDK